MARHRRASLCASLRHAAGAAAARGQLVANQPATTVGEDGRSVDQARAVLLAAAGGGPPDAAAVRVDGATDRRAALAGGVRVAAGKQTTRREEDDGKM